MKLLIVGLLAIFAGIALAANQSSDDVPTDSLLILSATQPVAVSVAPVRHREIPRAKPGALRTGALVETADAAPAPNSDI